METLFLIASILAYHYPSGLFRDTQRRYDNMRKYGKNFENGISPLDNKPIYKFPYALLSFLVGAIGPVFCLVEFNINWFLAIIINILIYFFCKSVVSILYNSSYANLQ